MKMSGKYKAACYCRLSQDDANDGTSVSIETQIKVLTDYCSENHFEIYDFYCDDGFTGTNFNRPNFIRMMSAVDSGAVNLIIVKDLSRFGREYVEVGNYIEKYFPKKNIRFIAIGDNVDTESQDYEMNLMTAFKSIFNEMYPADCSRKVKQAFTAKAKSGEFIGSQPPYGYVRSPQDKHVLVIDESTAPTVRRIFEMAAYSGYGYNKIARILSADKVITPTALQKQRAGRSYDKDPYEWNLATVCSMLNNVQYIGNLVSGKRRKVSYKCDTIRKTSEDEWIVNNGTHEPIISQELWEAAHAKLDSRKRTSKSGFVNIFAGLVKCDCCGYALGISNAKDTENYFTCNTYRKKGKDRCTIHYVKYDDLKGNVLENINSMLNSVHSDEDRFRSCVFEKMNTLDVSEKRRIDEEIVQLREKLDGFEEKLDTMYADRLSGTITDKFFKDFSEKLRIQQEQAEERLDELLKKQSECSQQDENVENFIRIVDEYDNVSTLDAEILNKLVDKIEVGERYRENGKIHRNITIYYRFLGNFGKVDSVCG